MARFDLAEWMDEVLAKIQDYIFNFIGSFITYSFASWE